MTSELEIVVRNAIYLLETNRPDLALNALRAAALTAPQPAAAPAIDFDAPAPAAAATWLDKPFTKAAPPATANEYARLETVVMHGFTHTPRINYANLTDSLQDAARRLIGRGVLVRYGDYITRATPPAPRARLTAAQRTALEVLAKVDTARISNKTKLEKAEEWEKRPYRGYVTRAAVKALEAQGYVKVFVVTAEITDAGKRALEDK